MFGFNDDTIDNLSSMPNRDVINLIFGGNREDVLYFFEKLDEYKRVLEKYKSESQKSMMNGAWVRDELNIAKYRLNEAFNTLIEK